jgi:hypothetical protein
MRTKPKVAYGDRERTATKRFETHGGIDVADDLVTC